MNQMSRKRYVLLAVLCAFLLAACGKTETPYLGGSEREKLEKQLIENIQMNISPDGLSVLQFSFKNTTGHDLQDFALVRSDNGNQLIWFSSIPAGGSVKCVKSSSEDLEKTGNRYSLLYTIGDYTYKSPYYTIYLQSSAEVSNSKIKVQLETDSGLKNMDFTKKMEFQIGNEIRGLKDSRIYSIESSVNYSPYDDVYNSLHFIINGKEPDKGNLICKVYDDKGILLGTADAYFSDGNWNAYFFTDFDPNVTYKLVFKELRG